MQRNGGQRFGRGQREFGGLEFGFEGVASAGQMAALACISRDSPESESS